MKIKRLLFLISVMVLLNGCAPTPLTVELYPTTSPSTNATPVIVDRYVLNTISKKFHLPSCRWANKIKEENRKLSTADREELLAEQYSPCGDCKP
jgi:hypothetical protein